VRLKLPSAADWVGKLDKLKMLIVAQPLAAHPRPRALSKMDVTFRYSTSVSGFCSYFCVRHSITLLDLAWLIPVVWTSVQCRSLG